MSSERVVGNPEIGISPTNRDSTASSGDANLGCVFEVRHNFTGEELQVKFLPDSGENSLKY